MMGLWVRNLCPFILGLLKCLCFPLCHFLGYSWSSCLSDPALPSFLSVVAGSFLYPAVGVGLEVVVFILPAVLVSVVVVLLIVPRVVVGLGVVCGLGFGWGAGVGLGPWLVVWLSFVDNL